MQWTLFSLTQIFLPRALNKDKVKSNLDGFFEIKA